MWFDIVKQRTLQALADEVRNRTFVLPDDLNSERELERGGNHFKVATEPRNAEIQYIESFIGEIFEEVPTEIENKALDMYNNVAEGLEGHRETIGEYKIMVRKAINYFRMGHVSDSDYVEYQIRIDKKGGIFVVDIHHSLEKRVGGHISGSVNISDAERERLEDVGDYQMNQFAKDIEF